MVKNIKTQKNKDFPNLIIIPRDLEEIKEFGCFISIENEEDLTESEVQELKTVMDILENDY